MNMSGARQQPRWHVVVAAMAALLVLSIVGCSGASKSTRSGRSLLPRGTTPADQSSSSTTIDPAATDKAEITKLYKDWARLDRVLASESASEDDERIDKFLGGPQLEHNVNAMRKQLASGQTVHFPVPSVSRSDVLTVVVDGDTAKLKTCEVDDAIVESPEGIVMNDRVMTFEDDLEARRTGDGWRIWASTRIAERVGVHSCT